MKATTLLLTFICLLPAAGALGADHFQALDVFELEYASDPRISPDGQRIVYLRNSMDIMEDRKRTKLWIINFDGRDPRRLTDGDGQESSPRWSPDGTRIAYFSDAEGSSQIYLRWMDSGQNAKLTQVLRSPRGITWSPDGQWIAFSMLVPDDPPQIARLPKKPEGANWADPPRIISRRC